MTSDSVDPAARPGVKSDGPQLVVADDPAAAGAARIVELLADAVARNGSATMALSGGSTAPALLAALAAGDVDWAQVGVWQVDERVAPDGHADRNANQLADFPGRHHLMPVTATDLAAAGADYAAGLPERFDVVHLGVGADGHTASWPPGDPVVDDSAPVALVGPFNGRLRMTLTPPVVNAAGARIVVVRGADKAGPLRRWFAGDRAVPVAVLTTSTTTVYADGEAAGGVSGRVGHAARAEDDGTEGGHAS